MTDLIERTRMAAKILRDIGGQSAMAATVEEAADAIEAAREDAERLDWLEDETSPGIRLHSGDFRNDEHIGLGIANTGRTLRQAIDDAREARNG